MSQEPIANLIDLGQYTRNDVELIAREFMRCAYLETLETFAKEYASLGERTRHVKTFLKHLNHSSILLQYSMVVKNF